MTSLAELKSIEQQRLADERTAVLRAEELRVQARIDTERRVCEEAEARTRAEYEAQLAIEQARVHAEREARLRVEAVEAAERARQQMLLEQERSQQEMELRRAEIAKKRPTWMVAVTAIAMVAAVVLVFFTVQALGASDVANQARIEAEKIAEQKRVETEAMHKELEKIAADLKILDGKMSGAMDRVLGAQTKAETLAAATEVKRLREERAAQERRAEDLRRKRLDDDRKKGVHNVCDGQAICKDTK